MGCEVAGGVGVSVALGSREAAARAALTKLLVCLRERSLLFLCAMTFHESPHQVEQLAGTRHAFALAGRTESGPCGEGHAETLDRRLPRLVVRCHISDLSGWACVDTRAHAIVVT